MPDLERWAEASGEVVKWYRDKFTGRPMDRPQMTKMLDDLNAGRLARIVVWRLDRLGRTARGLCQLFDDLHARKVDLVSLKDGFSLESPAGRLHARILASVAEYETEVRAERVRAGQAAAKARGKNWGGRKAGGMNRRTQDKRAAILKLHKNGESIVAISKAVGVSRPTVYRVLAEAN